MSNSFFLSYQFSNILRMWPELTITLALLSFTKFPCVFMTKLMTEGHILTWTHKTKQSSTYSLFRYFCQNKRKAWLIHMQVIYEENCCSINNNYKRLSDLQSITNQQQVSPLEYFISKWQNFIYMYIYIKHIKVIITLKKCLHKYFRTKRCTIV